MNCLKHYGPPAPYGSLGYLHLLHYRHNHSLFNSFTCCDVIWLVHRHDPGYVAMLLYGDAYVMVNVISLGYYDGPLLDAHHRHMNLLLLGRINDIVHKLHVLLVNNWHWDLLLKGYCNMIHILKLRHLHNLLHLLEHRNNNMLVLTLGLVRGDEVFDALDFTMQTLQVLEGELNFATKQPEVGTNGRVVRTPSLRRRC